MDRANETRHGLSVFNYLRANDFLRDSWEHKKSVNPSFSLRSWSRQLGLESHAPLHLVLSGKRHLPKKYIPKVVRSLQLDPKEGIYLELLVDLGRAKTSEQRKFYLDRISTIAPDQAVSFRELESFKLLEDPIHAAVIELTSLSDFQEDPKWIAQRLRPKISDSKAEEILKRVALYGLIAKSEGRFKKTNRHLRNKIDVSDLAVRRFHQTASKLSQVAAEEQRLDEREFNSFVFAVKRSHLPEAKQILRKFTKEFMDKFEVSENSGDELYLFNLHFFALTKNGEKK